MASERRPLEFESLEQVIEELDRLLNSGYSQTANWNLAQTCRHLTDWIGFSLDGYPTAPLPIRVMLWLMKITTGRRQFENVLKNGFRERLPTMPQTVHADDDTGETEAVQQLTETIRRFQNSTAPIHPSPLYGELTCDEANRLHLAHCAHHLRYLIPTKNDAAS